MDRAINKFTGKLVSAFEVYRDGAYQNLTKGEWIAPKDSVYNYDEISEEDKQVHYIKMSEISYKSGKNGLRCPHFAVYPGSAAKTVEESPTHKLLKDWLFNRLKENDLEILFARGVKPHKYENKYKLSELNINWNDYEIEVTTKGTKKLRADILLPFNNKHPLLGSGIIFEIQISNQSDRQTNERSIERALHGYSICWLFEEDFIIEEDNIQLKNNLLKINSFSEQMHFAKKDFVGKLKETVEEQCRYLNEKITNTNISINQLEDKKKEIIQEIDNYFNSKIEDINIQLKKINSNQDKLMEDKQKVILESIKKIENNPFNSIIESYKTELEMEFRRKERKINDIFNSLAEDLVKSNQTLKTNFQFWKDQMDKPQVLGQCRLCNSGTMMLKKGKYGDFYSCSRYPACSNTIKLKSVKYGETV